MLSQEALLNILQATADGMGKAAPSEVPAEVTELARRFSQALKGELQRFAEVYPLRPVFSVESLFSESEQDMAGRGFFEYQCLLALRGEEALWNGPCDHFFETSQDIHDFDQRIKANLHYLVNMHGTGDLDEVLKVAVEQHDLEQLRKSEEYYCCLQESEEDCTMDCGCRLIRSRSDEAVFLYQCEAHEAINELAKKVAGL
jgi:hypothetical protein